MTDRIHRFGQWNDIPPVVGPNGARLVAFLGGDDTGVEPELAAILRHEFACQSRLRSGLTGMLRALTESLRTRASDAVQAIESTPATQPYQQGYAQGKYLAYGEAAADVSHALEDAERASLVRP